MALTRSVASAAALAFAVAAHAQSWSPQKNVELVVPNPPGGSNDKTARTVERILSQLMLVPTSITVNNRPGGGTITTQIGYARIEPPSRWTVGSYPDARTQGQLWGRFDKKVVQIGWLDGHVKSRAIGALKGEGTTTVEIDKWWNGQN